MGNDVIFEGANYLSDEEKEALARLMNPEAAPKKDAKPKGKNIPKNISQIPKKPIKDKETITETEPVEEETVTKAKFDAKVQSLQKKIDALTKKNTELSEKKKELTNKLKESNNNYKSEKKERESLEKRNVALNTKCDGLSSELKSVKKQIDNSVDLEREKFVSELSDIKKEKEKLAAEKEELSGKLTEAEGRITKLTDEKNELSVSNDNLLKLNNDLNLRVKELESRPASAPSADADGVKTGVISRISETEFRSDLFTGPVYKVELARDCSFIKFKLDILGKGVNKNGVIALPSLKKYVQFAGAKEYDAFVNDNNEFTVYL